MSDDHAVARTAAEAAGELIRSRARDVGRVRVKGNETDLVSETDIAAGVEAVEAILRGDPGAAVLVEEDEVYELTGTSPAPASAGRVWVIDPLDGTTSFVHGFPCYSVSIALLEDGVPIVGAIHGIPLRETFSAARGAGAWCNDDSIRCSGAADLGHSLLITGFPYDRGETLDRQLAVLEAFLRAPVHGLRRDGSAALDCCHVASGRVDGFWEFGLRTWDMAAGVVICEEAGARVTDIGGGAWTVDSSTIVAAAPGVHDAMLDVIAAATRQ